jgi:hypothetical protein
MADHVLRDLRSGSRIWRGVSREMRQRQLNYMSKLVSDHYPAVRLHLFDGTKIYSAPYTVFGASRAVIYLGQSYLVVTGAQQILSISRHFDRLIRNASLQPQDVHRWLAELARS